MKVAVCYSGLCRGNIKRNISLARYHFPMSDLFFSTWKGEKTCGINEPISYYPQPKMHYHPVIDAIEECDAPKFKTYKSNGRKKICKKTKNGTKQILAHAHLLNDIDNSYDMIVRIRYDSVLSTNVSFTNLLEKSYNERSSIGFGTRLSRHKNFNVLREVPKIYPNKKNHKKVSHDWGWNLMDPMIFHRRDMFDTNNAFNLHYEKRLWNAEWGWYQMLSKPYGDNHSSIYGGVQIEKYLTPNSLNITVKHL